MVEFLINYWWIIVVLIAAISIAIIAVIRFINTPTNEQIVKVKSWLLQAVAMAEKELGGNGTGRVKLSYVYNMFISAWPKLALVISFDMFSGLVDEVLEQFRVMLESNTTLQDYIGVSEKSDANV